MKYIARILTPLFLLSLLLTSCGEEKGQIASFDESETAPVSEGQSEGTAPESTPTESESEATSESETDVEAFEVTPEAESELENFFSVEEYDYTAETDAEIIAFFGGDIGAALTKLAPSLKSVANAAFSYPEVTVSSTAVPEQNLLWSTIYTMIDTYHQYPADYKTDSEGRVVITGAATLKAMVSDIFAAGVGEISAPHEDFLDSMIYYDAAADTYTFEPTGGQGLNIRICSLELSGGNCCVTIQFYNSIFNFTSWANIYIQPDSESVYGYTVASATSWTEDGGLDEDDQ